MVSKLAHSGSGIEKLLAKGIEGKHFADRESANVWEFMTTHTRRYHQQPSISALREKFPSYDFILVSDAMEFILDKFLENLYRNVGYQILKDLAEALDDSDSVMKWPDMLAEQD